MMKCKAVQNEGIICIFLFLFVTLISCSFVGETTQTIQELCSSNRYIYSVDPGETRQFRLTSVISPGEINKWYQKSKRKCRKEFKTNNGASHFNVLISNMTIPSCSDKCQCNYFEIAEPGHVEKFCGNTSEDIYFETKGDYLSIDFHHKRSMHFEVTLTFTVQRNTYMITGLPKDGLRSGHFLESPYFPNLYQSDYIAEYILQSDDMRGHVMLLFLDFQIALESFIEVLGHNGTHPAKFNGNVFRPPVFVSQKHQLTLRFEANNQLRSGFRAVCFFLDDAEVQASKPFTNCGSIKDTYAGGSIVLEPHGNQSYYDCLWVISPPAFIFNAEPYFMSVSDISLGNIGSRASLEFREGLNSKAKLVKSIECKGSNCSPILSEITVSASTGFYIRFNGYLNAHSFVRMIYSTYHNRNCSEKEVKCNERCLLSSLRCDGIEQCPDGSDEHGCATGTTNVQITTHPTVIKKRLQSKNTLASFIVILAFGICGVFIVLLVVGIAIYRHLRVPAVTTEQAVEPEVISEMSGPPSRLCPRTSTYHDRLPSYDDFIKSSDSYPPLLFTRGAKRHSEPFANSSNIQHTTSFCGKDIALHRSVHSFDLRSLTSAHSDREASGQVTLFPEPCCSFSRSNIEWTDKNSLDCSLKRAVSFDSKLNKASDVSDCHFHLSITHSIHPRSDLQPKYHSLPTQLKIKEHTPNAIGITFQTVVHEANCDRQRSMSSCLGCRDSLAIRSEIMASIKTRCYSDPCKRVNLHYSLHP